MNMKNLSVMGLALSAILMTTNCGSSKNVLQPTALEGDWNIITVNGTAATAEKQPFISIDLQENKLSGCAGCNRIMGTIQASEKEAGKLAFTEVFSTRMICSDMKTERAVLEALNNVAQYKGTEKELTLTDNHGNALLTLEKRPETVLSALNGKWSIAQIYGIVTGEIEKAETAPFLEFDTEKKTVHGNTGCNIVNGNIIQQNGKNASLKFDQLITTMMAGPGMEIETKVIAAMAEVRSFVIQDENTLFLLDENGERTLTLKKQ